MTETSSLAQQPVPQGYAQRTVQVNGQPMTFTFYMGFVSRLTHTPLGGAEIVVYEQEGVFRVPGGNAPASRTKLWISGGPDQLDVELDIDDGPIGPPTYRGPIQGIQVVTKRNGGSATNPRVRPVKGGGSVVSIQVDQSGQGGVFPHMPPGDGGTTDVTNHANTCPPTC